MMKAVRDIDITLIRTFVAVVEANGMTRASRIQNMTQAAVSHQIKRLEELLDLELFDRSHKQITLTSAGERLFSYAKRMLALNDEVWAKMTAPSFEGQINLGVPHDIIQVFMPSILRSFSQAWPKINVTLYSNTTQTLLEMLDSGEVDITLTTEATRGTDMLMADNLVWAGMKGGLSYKKTPLPVALGGEKCAFRTAAVKVLSDNNIDWKFTCHTGSLEPVIATLEADMAVAPFLSQTVPDSIEMIPEIDGLPPLPTFYINMHLGASANEPIVQELATHIRNGFAVRYRNAA